MTAHASHAADFPGTLPQSPFFNLSWDLAHCALVISLRVDLRATLSLGALQALKALFSALDLQNKVRHIILRSESPEVFGGALDVDEIDDLAASAQADLIHDYAASYASVVHWIASAPERSIHPVALVRGNALGALGLVLPFSTLVVEEGARISKMPEAYCPLFRSCAQSYAAHLADPAEVPEPLGHDVVYDAGSLVANRVRVRSAPCGGGDAAVAALLVELQPRLPGFVSALRARLLLSQRLSLEGLNLEAKSWASRTWRAPADEASAGTQSRLPDWHDCQSISDHPAVDEAIRALLADQTGDNAVGMVREVIAQAERVGVLQRPLWYRDSTAGLHVGDSSFESWYSEQYSGAGKGEKQKCRDAYAAGMGDPLVIEAALAADLHTLTPAVRDVLLERQRHLEIGYSPEHDDEHGPDELAAVAACYGLGTTSLMVQAGRAVQPVAAWPQDRVFGSGDRRDQLLKFAALGLAALEAYDRSVAGRPSATDRADIAA